MPLISDPDGLSQGESTAVSDAVWGAPTGAQVTITSVGGELPTIGAGDFFAIRDHSLTVNNGLYVEDGGAPSNASITATKVSGSNPVASSSEAITSLGSSTDALNVFWDTLAYGIYLIEQNGLDAEGVNGQAFYSKGMKDWKDDDFLIANAPFPMLMIDADAGKAIVGQDASGNNNGWSFVDVPAHSIRSRKLVRNLGWSEVNAAGVILAIFAGIKTIGNFEDPANDFAYYQLGNDTTVDDTVNFTFAGPVNEPVQVYERLADGSINGGSGVSISADGRTLTRSDGDNWRTDGFLVGGRIIPRDSENSVNDGSLTATGFAGGAFLISLVEDAVDGDLTVGTGADATTGFDFVDGGGANDSVVRNDGGNWRTEGYYVGGVITVANANTAGNNGTFPILSLSADGLTAEVATATFTADSGDNTATFGPFDPTGSPDTSMNASIDNLNRINLRLRIRDADPEGKTFSSADLASADETILSNRLFKFGLANATDLKITATDGDMGSAPYSGMSITYYSTPQSLGGAGSDELVGGPFNFGVVIDANNGLDTEAFEFTHYQERQTSDIDAGAGTVIGRTADDLLRFLGDALEVGSADGGLTFPRNPLGGGDGVMVINLNPASRNTTIVFDNTGAKRSFPVGTLVTLDFNQTLIDDTVAEYTLFFDSTIENPVGDLIITAVSGANGTFDSAGANLPASLDVGVNAYIRVAGLTGADAAMNGIYQVTALTSQSQWDVTRKDGATIVTTGSASVSLGEHPIDSPDAVIVEDNTDTPVQGLASGDFSFTFDYSGNTQGGRTGGTDANVLAKAIGQQTAQYTQSTVQTIESGTPLVIPVASNIERNVIV